MSTSEASWRNADALQYVEARDIAAILDESRPALIQVVAETYQAFYSDQALNPNTYSLRFPQKPNSRINALPSYVGQAVNLAGLKWVASFPDNVRTNKQRASAIIIVNSFDTGYPLAVLDGTMISSARTAASAALAARLLRPSKSAQSFTLFGAGIINRDLLRFLLADGWTFSETKVSDPDANSRSSLELFCSKHGLATAPVEAGTPSDSDLISFATSALEPWYDYPIGPEQTVLHISLRDILPQRLREPVVNIVDDVKHAMNSNTSLHLLQKMQGDVTNVENYGPALSGLRSDRSAAVVSAFGMGMLDLAVAAFVMDRAEALGKIRTIAGLLPHFSRW